jgi:hypothetical protein
MLMIFSVTIMKFVTMIRLNYLTISVVIYDYYMVIMLMMVTGWIFKFGDKMIGINW